MNNIKSKSYSISVTLILIGTLFYLSFIVTRIIGGGFTFDIIPPILCVVFLIISGIFFLVFSNKKTFIIVASALCLLSQLLLNMWFYDTSPWIGFSASPFILLPILIINSAKNQHITKEKPIIKNTAYIILILLFALVPFVLTLPPLYGISRYIGIDISPYNRFYLTDSYFVIDNVVLPAIFNVIPLIIIIVSIRKKNLILFLVSHIFILVVHFICTILIFLRFSDIDNLYHFYTQDGLFQLFTWIGILLISIGLTLFAANALKNEYQIRQTNTSLNFASNKTVKQSEDDLSIADTITKYKELLDLGIITQEEFDAKKNEILNL